MSKLLHIPFAPLGLSNRTSATITEWGAASQAGGLSCQVSIGEPSFPSVRQAHIVFAANADGATGSFNIFQKVQAQGTNMPYTFEQLGTGTFTAGTASSTVLNMNSTVPVMADTIAFTASGYYNTLLAALGSPAVQQHSPADNTIAYLMLPELGSMDIFVDCWVTSGTAVQAAVRTLL